ncbi:MAG: sensor histidine kinase [Bacteroidota bacterium]
MRLSKLVIVLLIQFSLPAYSQTSFDDSLKVITKSGTDSTRLEVLVRVFNKYSAKDYGKARIAGYQLLPLMRATGDVDRLADFLMRMGQTEYTYGNHQEALGLYLESAGLYHQLKLPAQEASIFNEIAVLHRKNNNTAKSREYVNAALDLYKLAYDTNGVATTLNNLGIIHEMSGDLEAALTYYRQSKALYVAFKCDLCISYSLDYMAGAFKALHQFDSAFYYEYQSLEMRRKLDNTYAVAQSLMTMGEIYFEQKKYTDAITYFTECASLCRSINFKDYERRAYEYLSKCHELNGNFKDALHYHMVFSRIDDSLFNETRSKQISELQIRYETEKNEGEIRSLKQTQQINNYILISTILFLLLIVAGAFFIFRQQQLKNRLSRERAITEAEEGERLRIAKDIHDDLGSGLSKIHFLSQELMYKADHGNISKNMASVIEISRSLIDSMRDLVWELNTEDTSLDNLVARIREYSTDYLEDLPIRIISDYPAAIPDTPLGKIVYRNIFMTVKEVLNNIVKHSGATHVYIKVDTSSGELKIDLRDNGIGFADHPDRQGNGMVNMKSRISLIGGSLNILSSDAGTRITLHYSLGKHQILL